MSTPIESLGRNSEQNQETFVAVTLEPHSGDADQAAGAVDSISRIRAVTVVVSVASVNFLNTMASGILTVALPRMAKDLKLPAELLLWPASIFALTCGCSLLLAGAVADIVGRRRVFLTGCVGYAAFMLGCGLSESAAQLIASRACQGIAISLCLTTAVGIIAHTFAAGPSRTFAFASLGAGQPVGYAVGLVLGGVLVDTVGWRYGYYIAAGANILIFLAAFWGLPSDEVSSGAILHRLLTEVDWIGAFAASVSLGTILTALAMITSSTARLGDATTIALLSLGGALIPAFIIWVSRQEKLGKPAIIPNSVWRETAFSMVCLNVFFTWAAFNSFGYFATLYFQEIQTLSALQASLRFLPTVVCGFLVNAAIGFLLRVTSADSLVIGSSILTVVAAALMALANPDWPYWYAVFPAIFLSPTSSDVIYTVSNIVVSNAFPSSTQSLAGGVFNTVAQIGNSAGLAIAAVIASTVTAASNSGHIASTEATLSGYRAAGWFEVGSFLVVIVLSSVQISGIGRRRSPLTSR